MTTIRNALTDAASQLSNAHEAAVLESEILLAHVLEKSRTWLHTWPEHQLTAGQLSAFNALVERRLQGEPSAHITGEREFWSLPLEVTSDTLIPRAETELLVALALEQIPRDAAFNVADLGTGSGAIALALASERPDAQITAIDASTQALAVAERNSKRLGLNNVTFHHGSWFAPVADQTFDVIVSNPPYIREGDPHLNEGDLPFEPRSALVAADNGLGDIRIIVAESRARLSAAGWLLIEHGFDQADAVGQIFKQYGYSNASTHRDFSGQPRVTSGQYHSGSKQHRHAT